MICVDASVVLVHLFGEGKRPRADLWNESLATSRLTQYEVWTRVHAHRLGTTLGEAAGLVLQRLAILELTSPVLARALQPFPTAVRPLDALHLASMEFLRAHGETVRLAAYDDRMLKAARKLGIEPYPL